MGHCTEICFNDNLNPIVLFLLRLGLLAKWYANCLKELLQFPKAQKFLFLSCSGSPK